MIALATRVASKPGPFVARTPDGVWNQAWRNFNEGETGGLDWQVEFIMDLQRAGYGIRALAVGGFALDKVT